MGLAWAAIAIGLVAAAGGLLWLRMRRSFQRAMAAVWRAGYVERQTTIAGTRLNYAEGPAGGAPLLLVHGQATDWKNYARVLPDLARRFHVFAVDVHGHGASDRAPSKYDTQSIGADLVAFIREVIGEPAVISGHSSGGLLCVWIAAHAPAMVRGVVLEDPPLFTTLLPRAEKTWNYVDLATTAQRFVTSGEDDFVAFAARHGKLFTLFKGLQPRLVRSVLEHRDAHPDAPVSVAYMPPSINEFFRGLHRYDPRFGQAFYDGRWNRGLEDPAEALATLEMPVVLIHANWSYDEDGILMAAMDEADAQRAVDCIPNVRFVRVNSGHGFHFEKPKQFVQLLADCLSRDSGCAS